MIIDNDFAGDPDDLVQLVHHLLSPAVDVRLVVASHLAPGDGFDPGPDSARHGLERVHEVLAAMGIDASDPEVEGGSRIVLGAPEALAVRSSPRESPAALAVVAEALRDDDRPLYYCAGGGLTDLASALLLEPRVADRLVLVWIGGPEHPGLALPPPGASDVEYNLAIDVRAAQVVFDHPTLPLWQVPRDAYRRCLVSDLELRTRMAPHGPVGALLHEALLEVGRRGWHGPGWSQTYVLGDSPLVLLTALQSFFEPDPSSSEHVLRPAPRVDDDGRVHPRDDGRPIRVFTRLDVRLLFEDLFAALAAFARWQEEASP